MTSESARPAAIKLREQARQLGVKTALTFSDPAMVRFFKDGLKEMIGDGVDLLFCNEEEACLFTDTDNAEAALESLKPIAGSIVITLGAKGALLWDGEAAHRVEPVTVKAVDTNGAGDMFAGAFLYAITHGHDFPTAGKLAAAASARVVSDFGPRLKPESHQAVRDSVLGSV